MRKRKYRIKGKITGFFLCLSSLVYMVPLWMVLVNSFKPKREANLFRLSLPADWALGLKNYMEVIDESNLLRHLFNGLYIGLISTVLVVIFSSAAAFIIARRRDKITKFLYYFFVSGIIIPVAFVPTYLVMLVTQLNNTFTGLILIYSTIIIPFCVFIYTGFVKTVPAEIDESAIVDGCGALRLFFKIVLPLMKPVTITVIVFSFMNTWNDVQLQLFFASSSKWGLPMSVFKFSNMYYTEWNLIFANIILSMLPVLLIYFIGQKQMVDGLTAGAVKG